MKTELDRNKSSFRYRFCCDCNFNISI